MFDALKQFDLAAAFECCRLDWSAKTTPYDAKGFMRGWELQTGVMAFRRNVRIDAFWAEATRLPQHTAASALHHSLLCAVHLYVSPGCAPFCRRLCRPVAPAAEAGPAALRSHRHRAAQQVRISESVPELTVSTVVVVVVVCPAQCAMPPATSDGPTSVLPVRGMAGMVMSNRPHLYNFCKYNVYEAAPCL